MQLRALVKRPKARLQMCSICDRLELKPTALAVGGFTMIDAVVIVILVTIVLSLFHVLMK